MGLNSLQVIPGYQLGATEILTASILNQMAKPTVMVTLDDPFNDQNYFRNGNFYSSFWGTPGGVNCPAGSQTGNATPWFCQPSGSGNVSYLQSATTPDVESLYSARLTGATGITDVLFGQQISFDLSATLRRTDAFSGWIFNGTMAAFTPTVQVATANVQGNFSAVTVAAELALPACAPGAWTYVSLTQDLSQYANVANGLQLSFHIPTGVLNSNSNYVLFARLKLQTGNVATAFADDISQFITAPTINTANIANSAVTGAKIAALAVTGGTPSGNLAPNTIVAGYALNVTINTTISSTAVTIPDPSGNIFPLLSNGMYINSANLPPNTTISGLATASGNITGTLSVNATATATGTAAVIGAGNFAPTTTPTQPWLVTNPANLPASWTQWGDEFDGSLKAKWTVTSSGAGNAVTQNGGRLVITGPGTAGYAQAVQAFSLSSGVAFEFLVACDNIMGAKPSAAATPQIYMGLVGTSVSLCMVLGTYVTGVFNQSIGAVKGNQTNGGSNISAFSLGSQESFGYPRYIKFGYDGTNLYLSISSDGINFLQVYNESYTSGPSFGGAAVTGIVLGMYFPNGNGWGQASFDFLRKTI